MAEIVLGLGTSHGPMLSMQPELWLEFGEGDRLRREPLVAPDGTTVSYDELLARANPGISKHLTLESRQRYHAAAQKALAMLGQALRDARPDAVVIISNDQQELFYDDNMPCFAVFWGNAIPLYAQKLPTDAPRYRQVSAWGWGDADIDVPVDSKLARHIIDFLVPAGFDLAHLRYIREQYGGSIGPAGYIKGPLTVPARRQGLPHGMAFVVRRIMDNKPLPIVPLFQNTFYPPNQPTTRRCYALGQALREAIGTWDRDARVAVIASGGFSHFVIDPEIDDLALEAFGKRDPTLLFALPEHRLQSGTSEIKDWITLAGACEGLEYRFVDRTPGYRSAAGTGHADGFAIWR